MKLSEIKNKYLQLTGQKQMVENEINVRKKAIRVLQRDLCRHEQAKEVIKQVGLKTQQQLQYHISDITSLALGAVFPEPYTLEIEFIQRRNKTECDIYFVKDENRVDPLSASGGGAVDIAAFALRIASWSMMRPHSSNTIILDEPMRFVSEGLRDKASQMIKEVGDKLGLQFIIITHDPKLASYADRTFEVTQRKGMSNVKQI